MLDILASKIEEVYYMFITEIKFEHEGKTFHAEFGLDADKHGEIRIDYQVLFGDNDKEVSQDTISDALWDKLSVVALERYKDSYDNGEMYEYI